MLKSCKDGGSVVVQTVRAVGEVRRSPRKSGEVRGSPGKSGEEPKAEAVGFEPTSLFRTTAFKAVAIAVLPRFLTASCKYFYYFTKLDWSISYLFDAY
jgi:hypothetical protein